MIAVQSTTVAMQVHDDLASLLARSLTLNPTAMPAAPLPEQSTAVVPEPPKIIYSISQHYNHSGHVVKPVDHAVEEKTEQLQQQHELELQKQREQQEQAALAERQQIGQLLIHNGVDPTSLNENQVSLFTLAPPENREYLLRLWREYPPVRGSVPDINTAGMFGATAGTSLEKETMLAQLRLHQKQQTQVQSQSQNQDQGQGQMSLDGTMVSNTSPCSGLQAEDGSWSQSTPQNYMEPYMVSGYEELANREYQASAVSAAAASDRMDDDVPRSKEPFNFLGSGMAAGFGDDVTDYHPATDPVYNNRLAATSNRASWPPQHLHQTMEDQYGSLMAMRETEMEL